MPAGAKPGERRGGRSVGTPNKSTASAREKLASMNCEPVQGMATIALNNLPCGVCRGEGRTRYSLGDSGLSPCDDALCVQNRALDRPDPAFFCLWCSNTGERNIGTRTCLSCYGTLFEACSPELRGKMYAELATYVHTKLKAIEHTGADGAALPSWQVVLKTVKSE